MKNRTGIPLYSEACEQFCRRASSGAANGGEQLFKRGGLIKPPSRPPSLGPPTR